MKPWIGLLFGFVSNLCAMPPEVEVRIVTFEASEAEWIDRAAHVPAGDGSAAFASLIAGVEDGTVAVAGDSMVRVRSGHRSKTEGLAEVPYPPEFDGDGARQFPMYFEFNNTGCTLECEATDNGEWIDLNLAPEAIRFRGMREIPCMVDTNGAAQQGAVQQPVFLTEKCATQVACRNGIPVLISQSRPADVWDERPGGSAQRTLLTFVIATQHGEREGSPTVGMPVQARLHLSGVRMSNADALSLLDLPDEGAVRYSGAGKLVAEGRASFTTGAALICRSGRRAAGQATSDFPWPSRVEIVEGVYPTAFECTTMGDLLEWELGTDGEDVRISHILGGRPILHRSLVQAGAPDSSFELPEFRTLEFTTQWRLRPGFWSHLGMVPCRDDDLAFSGQGTCVVWFGCVASAVPAAAVEGASSFYAATIPVQPDKVGEWKLLTDDPRLPEALLQYALAGQSPWSVAGVTAGRGSYGQANEKIERPFPRADRMASPLNGVTGNDSSLKVSWAVAEPSAPELFEAMAAWKREADAPDPPDRITREWTLAGSGEHFAGILEPSLNGAGEQVRFLVATPELPRKSTVPEDPAGGSERDYTWKEAGIADLTAEDQRIIRAAREKYAQWKAEWQDPREVKTWQAELEITPLPEADGKWHFAGWKETEGPEGKGTAAVLVRRE